MTARNGVLVTLEGCDGCGKSTQAAPAVRAPRRLRPAGGPGGARRAPSLREPGGTPAGEAIRDAPAARALAAGALDRGAALRRRPRRARRARCSLPELAAGLILVLDRYVDSSLAYQGFARGLGHRRGARPSTSPPPRGLLPDLTLVLEVDPVVGLAAPAGAPDRIEAEGVELQQRVAAGFDELARRFPERVRSSTASAPSDWSPPTSRRRALEAVADAGLRARRLRARPCSTLVPGQAARQGLFAGALARRPLGPRLPAGRPRGPRQGRVRARARRRARRPPAAAAAPAPSASALARGVHPDLHVVEREGEFIRVEQIGRVIADLGLKPFSASRRVWVIPEVET